MYLLYQFEILIFYQIDVLKFFYKVTFQFTEWKLIKFQTIIVYFEILKATRISA